MNYHQDREYGSLELMNLESEGIHELETLDAIKHWRQDQRQCWTRIRGVIEAKNK